MTKEGNNFDNRPFNSLAEMHQYMKEKWNSKITNGDTVYILGDIAMRGTNEELIALVAQLKGRKVLIKGNHDDVSDLRYKNLFEETCTYKEVTDHIGQEAYKLVLSHYPILMWNGQHRGERFDVDTNSLIYTRRCSEEICSFIRDKLGIQIQSARINAGTVIRPSNIQEILDDKNIVKLVYDNASHYSFRAVNWSYSKGDTYDAACVILNGSTEKLVEDKFSVSTLKTVTLNKLYVALTRSKGDLYIVTQDEFETVKEKYYK